MRIATKAQHQEITTTVRKLQAERTAIMLPGVECLGRPARFVTGRPAARHLVGTERMLSRPAPRTVRTTHDGRRVAMRRTGRLA